MSAKAHPNINAAGLAVNIVEALVKNARGAGVDLVMEPGILNMVAEFSAQVSRMLDLMVAAKATGIEVGSRSQEAWLEEMLERLREKATEKAPEPKYIVMLTYAQHRWVIANADNPGLAWSGSQWVTHDWGIPTGMAQICNFDTEAEAEEYAKNCEGLK